MRSHMYKGKVNFILLCFIFCMLFTGCNSMTSQANNTAEGELASKVDGSSLENGSYAASNELEYIVPEELTMEIFGINILKVNRPLWEEHIFSLYDPDTCDYSVQFNVGDYKITNSYLNYQNENNLSTYIWYREDFSGLSVLFDENDDLKNIEIDSDMGEEFHTSFLNIGDNVKDYLESVQPGLWDKFLNDEMNRIEQGWYIQHSTLDVLEYTYDIFQISNDDIVVSYFITDELVDSIHLTVVGDIHIDNDETSIYKLDNFELYINGTDISTMSMDDWINFMYLPEANVHEQKIVNEEFVENTQTGNLDLKTEVLSEWKDFYYRMEGTDILIHGIVKAESARFELYNINDMRVVTGGYYVPVESIGYIEPDVIEFYIWDEGHVEQRICITGACRQITGNYIIPGDNIKTFLNSLEEGFYEKITSLPENGGEYRIGPYVFSYVLVGTDSTGSVITIRRNDERFLPAIYIIFKDEIVTRIEK